VKDLGMRHGKRVVDGSESKCQLLGSNNADSFRRSRWSGTDSKAGGLDYLLLFTQAKWVAEKLR
jgi:hypothetical protein